MRRVFLALSFLFLASGLWAENYYAQPDRSFNQSGDLTDRALRLGSPQNQDQSLRMAGAGILAPGWVLRAGGRPANVDCNFALFPVLQECWVQGIGMVPMSQLLSITRASQETRTWGDGHIDYVPSGMLAVSDLGLQVWEGRTNDAKYSNDLTQTGSWTATNVTAALNATGPDNVANSASTITAGAANSTILQSITLASQADTYSVYVKCVTCTGNIQVAEYPSGTPAFTTLSSSNCFNQAGTGTAPNTSTWVRCQVEATVLNPVIGFNIVTSGDSVQVFCNQLEPGAFRSPCIPTGASTAARSADNILLAGPLLNLVAGTQGAVGVASGGIPNAASQSYATLFGGADGGSAATYLAQNSTNTTSLTAQDTARSNTMTITLGNSTTITSPFKAALSWAPGSRAGVANNGTVTTNGNSLQNNSVSMLASSPAIGSQKSTFYADSNFLRFTGFTFQPSNSQLGALTQ